MGTIYPFPIPSFLLSFHFANYLPRCASKCSRQNSKPQEGQAHRLLLLLVLLLLLLLLFLLLPVLLLLLDEDCRRRDTSSLLVAEMTEVARVVLLVPLLAMLVMDVGSTSSAQFGQSTNRWPRGERRAVKRCQQDRTATEAPQLNKSASHTNPGQRVCCGWWRCGCCCCCC